MMSKPKAETSTGLGPTGLLPYIYGVWMAIRTGQRTEWPLEIHDRKYAGVATFAARTGADIEVAKLEVLRESRARVIRGQGHQHRATTQSCKNMMFDMYKGHRPVKARGSVARPRSETGLVAGCAFVEKALKACVATIKIECPE